MTTPDAEHPAPARTVVPVEERRALLLAAAWRVMRRDGVRAASTRAITTEAGMPHGAFHYCFHSKRELFAALVAQEITGNTEETWAALPSGLDPETTLRTVFHAYWQRVLRSADEQLVLVELTSYALRDPELAELPRWEDERYVQQVAEYLQTWSAREGLTWSVPLDVLAGVVVGGLSGIMHSWMTSHDADAALARLDAFAAGLAGLATSTGQTTASQD